MGKGTGMIVDMTLFPVSISRGGSIKDNNGVSHCLEGTTKLRISAAQCQHIATAKPRFRRLLACVSRRRAAFDPSQVPVQFVVGKVALGQVFPRALRFSPVSLIPPVLH
jgi:hypothetical protein